ncbi:protease [Salipaludibacillus neizhouensis]|uniref:Protease n=1 Tax=Salipaludibacillus neizhouensis TaxID=885475 RepID=A0A3A9K4W3_9BACI|nr:M50 family metallopeptidase [Salipaludibacillus neizhouensis]RKL65900.1 protease [Salipaludibacillus neizhouensis]
MIDFIRKITIHPVLWVILGIGGMTGLFKEILMILIIVFIHELGHSLVALRFGWRIRKITLLPFGGMAEMDEYGNRPAKEEILVTIAGPIQHIWLIGISYLLVTTPVWSEGDHRLFLFHNLTILAFNLLPVLPLDGGKLIFTLTSMFLPFQKSYDRSFGLSVFLLINLTCISLLILPFHLNLIVIICFIWVQHYLEWRQRHYHFLRFILERNSSKQVREIQLMQVSSGLTVAQAIQKIYREKELIFYFKKGNEVVQVNEKKLLQAYFQRNARGVAISHLA